ncbi:MAG: 2-hydroxyacyl-CoA dehydratase subunit D [Candidatus Kariarchaeaceae archaeon]|jgi:benzoyl-CoA reductase/2-hydroxyglutaryl-CoA dehydratase subunit BcrC/BadD/HgdB
MVELQVIKREEKERAYNKLASMSYKKAMASYYRNSKILPKIPFLKKKVAWITSGAPVEFLVAAGVIPLYPENYAAILGGSKTSVQACMSAENEGYSNELCSYARCHLGTVFQPQESLMNGLSKPDFLVSSNNICGTVVKWFHTISEIYEIPHFHFDTPPITGEQESHVFTYVRNQIDEYIEFIETHTGKRINQKKLLNTFDLSNQATKLWIKILHSCKNLPSPLNCPDRFITMAPIVTQRGLKRTIKVYQELLQEVQQRVENGIGAIKDEKIRLLWDNIAIWYYLYPFYNKLASRGVVFPVDTYTNAWSMAVSAIDIDTALDEAARVYSHVYLNQDLKYRVNLISNLIKDFKLDGFVLHSNKACKRYSMGMLTYKKAITKQTGVPGVIIDGDMVDSRNFSEEQTWTRLESFLEMIDARKD